MSFPERLYIYILYIIERERGVLGIKILFMDLDYEVRFQNQISSRSGPHCHLDARLLL